MGIMTTLKKPTSESPIEGEGEKRLFLQKPTPESTSSPGSMHGLVPSCTSALLGRKGGQPRAESPCCRPLVLSPQA
jgi:hypothetical protein